MNGRITWIDQADTVQASTKNVCSSVGRTGQGHHETPMVDVASLNHENDGSLKMTGNGSIKVESQRAGGAVP